MRCENWGKLTPRGSVTVSCTTSDRNWETLYNVESEQYLCVVRL